MQLKMHSDNNIAIVSQKKLSQYNSTTTRSIRKKLKYLEEENFIKIIQRGSKKTNKYILKYEVENYSNTENNDISNQQNKIKNYKYNPGYVYLLKCENKNIYKIGYSKNAPKRVRKLNTEIPFKLFITHLIRTDNMVHLEKYLHDKYNDKRMNGEYFRLNQNDVKYIKSLNYETVQELYDTQKVDVVR